LRRFFTSFSELVSDKTIGKRKWGTSVEFVAQELKNLFAHECSGMSVKDAYNFFDKSSNMDSNKFCKIY